MNKVLVFKEFGNETMHVRAVLDGIVDKLAPKIWQTPYLLDVYNVMENGKRVRDPVGTKRFVSEALLMEAYAEFLAGWSECYIDDNNEFVEVGNTIMSSVDVPNEYAKDENFGSW